MSFGSRLHNWAIVTRERSVSLAYGLGIAMFWVTIYVVGFLLCISGFAETLYLLGDPKMVASLNRIGWIERSFFQTFAIVFFLGAGGFGVRLLTVLGEQYRRDHAH